MQPIPTECRTEAVVAFGAGAARAEAARTRTKMATPGETSERTERMRER